MLKNISDKIKPKLLLFLIPLLLLTGCSYTSEVGKDTAINTNMNVWQTKMELDEIFQTNLTLTKDMDSMFDSIIKISDNTYKFLDQSGDGLKTVLNTTTILAAALIMIKFALSVLKENLYEQNKQMATDMATRIKKVIVAIVLTLTVPYICVTSFAASTTLGTIAAQMGQVQNDELAKTLTEMEKDNVSFSTLCLAGQSQWKNARDTYPNSKNNINYIPSKDTFSDVDKAYFGNKNGAESWSKKYCPGYNNKDVSKRPNNVYEALFEGTELGNALPYKYGANSFDRMMSTLTRILIMFVTIFSSYCVAKRVVELIFLIATSWWYIGSSVGDTLQEASLKSFVKQLLNICLSQFFLIYEFGIFTLIIGRNVQSSFALALAFLLVMLKTPSAIAEMVSDTGTSSQAISVAKMTASKVGLTK